MANFGTRTDKARSLALLDRDVEAGGTWVDTSNCYAYLNSESVQGGQSEAVLGQWLRTRPGSRELIKISTKVGSDPVRSRGQRVSLEGLGKEAIRSGLGATLDRMATDHVDLYWVHQDDPLTDQDETVAEFGRLVGDGLAHRWGYSNAALWRVERARQIAVTSHTQPPSALQFRYTYLQLHPMVRDYIHDHRFGWMTDEMLDYAGRNRDVGLWVYSPLMSGAYDRSDRPIPTALDHPGNPERLDALNAVSERLGCSLSELVVAWLAGGRPPINPIVGVSNEAQLAVAMSGSRLDLPQDDREQLDAPW